MRREPNLNVVTLLSAPNASAGGSIVILFFFFASRANVSAECNSTDSVCTLAWMAFFLSGRSVCQVAQSWTI